ncbi:MAG: DUF374 domain-containing protein [Deltaproteobacteria bacterium]|nr:DUF374 domain-containing protein [Deltaproteobacteria bacterium]
MKKKILDTIGVSVIPCVAFWLMRALRATMRLERVNFGWYQSRVRSGANCILAFWHGRLMMMPFAYEGRGITILASASRDGELVSKTLAGFGIDTVRGSTSRGAFSGLKGILSAARAGRDIAITPDGPRGPAFKAQMGVIQLAKATGLPILPVSFSASKKKLSTAGTVLLRHIRFQEGSISSARPCW